MLGDAPHQIFHCHRQRVREGRFLGIVCRYEVGDPLVFYEALSASPFFAILIILDADGDTDGLSYKREAGNVCVTIANEDHVVKWDAQALRAYLAVDCKKLIAASVAYNSPSDLKDAASFVREADDLFRERDLLI